MKSFVLYIFILLFSSCFYIKSEPIISNPDFVYFPKIKPDSALLINNDLNFFITDSSENWGNTSSYQANFFYAIQMTLDTFSFDELIFNVNLPNRVDGNISYSMSKELLIEISQNLSHTYYKKFTKELLDINWENYTESSKNEWTTLDKLNMAFASIIDKKYKTNFNDNNLWFGYDSFKIFRLYFIEVEQNKIGMYHSIIDDLKTSNYLDKNEKDQILNLVKLNSKYF